MTLHICENPKNVHKSEPKCKLWALGDSDVSLQVQRLTKVPIWFWMLTVGEAV